MIFEKLVLKRQEDYTWCRVEDFLCRMNELISVENERKLLLSHKNMESRERDIVCQIKEN